MGNQTTPPQHGIEGLAHHLGVAVREQPTGVALDSAIDPNQRYMLLHIYLVPGDAAQRGELRLAIATQLANWHAIRLHDLAYAIPSTRAEGRETAEAVWAGLIQVGAHALGENGPEAWEEGDSVYLHYFGYDAVCVLAARPRHQQSLPLPYGP